MGCLYEYVWSLFLSGRDDLFKNCIYMLLRHISTYSISLFDSSFENKCDSENRLIEVLMSSNLKASTGSSQEPMFSVQIKAKRFSVLP